MAPVMAGGEIVLGEIARFKRRGTCYGDDDDNEDGEPRLDRDILRRDFPVSEFTISLPTTTLELLPATDYYCRKWRPGREKEE
ncbi:hypothetical protein TIFTF001_031039 [Ficus carica]|uniref:Uncharacterized protein n=1 Tax=Ficus carica TaxID=3494 RepID=A0AA88DW59_FICCA|nr:hypothetical protein TIFTF001_031039 [Ficus carica]